MARAFATRGQLRRVLTPVVQVLLVVTAIGGFEFGFGAAKATPASALTLPSSVQEFAPNLAGGTSSPNWGGRTVAVTTSPTNNQNTISASESGGLFRTTNDGTSWSHVDGFPLHRMSDVRYAPSNDSVVIATAVTSNDTQNPGGIWRSTDGGNTWANVSSSPAICPGGNFDGLGIAFEPGNSNVYVGTGCGVAVSPDLGATWTLQGAGRVLSVAASSGGIVDACATDGHRRYTNSGGTLTQQGTTTQIAGQNCPQGNGYYGGVHNMAVAPGDSGAVFAVVRNTSSSTCGSGSNDYGLYETDNPGQAGESWTSVGIACAGFARPQWLATHASSDGTANHFDIFYSSGLDIHKITCTSGITTQRCTGTSSAPSDKHSDLSDLSYPPGTNCPEFLSGDSGLQVTTDCGATFHQGAGSGTSNGNYNALQIYQVTGQIHPTGTDLYLGTQDNDIWASGNNGSSWPNQICCEGFNMHIPAQSPSGSGQTLTGTACSGCNNFKSGALLAGNTSWNNPSGGNPGPDTGSPALVEPGVYVQWSQPTAPTNQLNISTNTGGAWSTVSGATIAQALMGEPVVVGPAGSPTIYQAYCTNSCGFIAPSGGLKRITGARTSSATVNAADTGITVGTYNTGDAAFLSQQPSFGVDPNNPLHLIAADVGSSSMKQSTDGGQTWTVDNGLTNLVTGNGRYGFTQGVFGTESMAIAWDPYHAGHILVGTETGGIIGSLDNGNSWFLLNNSQQVPAVTSFFFDNVQNDIIVSSYGRGLWKLNFLTADLSITKTHHPDPAIAGQDLYWDITVTNNGPDAAPQVVVTDNLPAQDTFLTANVPCTSNSPPPGTGATVNCQLGDLANGQSVTFEIKTLVNANTDSLANGPTNMTNTATVGSLQAIDPDTSNNTASDTVIVEESADLQLTKICDNSTVQAGQNSTCTIYVDNHGPSDARNVVLTDTLTSTGSFTIVSATPSQGTPCTFTAGSHTSNTVTCDLGTIAAASSTVTGRATTAAVITASEAQTVSDVASVNSDTPDPNSSNNTATASVSFSAVADLAITSLTGTPNPVTAGQNLTYALAIKNLGPSTATNVVLADNLPAGVKVVSVTASGGTPPNPCTAGVPGDSTQPTTCAFGTLAVNATGTMTIVVTVLPQTTGIIHDDARVSSDTFDPNNSNNLAHVDTNVTVQPDLLVTTTSNHNPATAGLPMTYTTTITNQNPGASGATSTATNVVLTQTLDSKVTFASATITGGTGACSLGSGTPQPVICQLGTLNPGQQAVVYINVTVNANAADSAGGGSVTISSTATATSDGTDMNAADNTTTLTTTVTPSADLGIVLTSDASVYKPSTTIHYTITVTNAGPSDAVNLVITQNLPTVKQGKYVSNSLGCPPPSTTTLTCSYTTLPVLVTVVPGETITFQVNFFITGNKQTITSSASVTSPTPDPAPGNNTSTRNVTVK